MQAQPGIPGDDQRAFGTATGCGVACVSKLARAIPRDHAAEEASTLSAGTSIGA